MASPSSSQSNSLKPILDKTLGSVANLAQLLPTGTVFAFEALSPSFTNRGICHMSNKYLTIVLIGLCALSVFFFSFTDSLKGSNKKLYYGIATFNGFYVFNYEYVDEERLESARLQALRIHFVDFIHAFFSCLTFLSIAVGDSDVQRCFAVERNPNTRELFRNLPLGIGFLASLVFFIFPSSRKGIGNAGLRRPRP
ncbi:hypothetical protein ACHQM5_026901 [Ranunculus cassubicifolius]